VVDVADRRVGADPERRVRSDPAPVHLEHRAGPEEERHRELGEHRASRDRQRPSQAVDVRGLRPDHQIDVAYREQLARLGEMALVRDHAERILLENAAVGSRAQLGVAIKQSVSTQSL